MPLIIGKTVLIMNLINFSSDFSFNHLTSSLLVDDRIFRISNPLKSFEFNQTTVIPWYFKDYVYNLPSNEQSNFMYTSNYPSRSSSFCKVIFADIEEVNFCMPIFDCCLDEFKQFRLYLTEESQYLGPCKFSQFDYIIKPKYHQLKTHTPFWYELSHDNQLSRYENPFHCFCSDSPNLYPYGKPLIEESQWGSLEPTNGITQFIKGLGASFYSNYQMFSAGSKFSETDMDKIMSLWGLELIELGLSFTPKKLLFSFLKFLVTWCDPKTLVDHAIDLFNRTYMSLKNLSQQLHGDPDLEATSLLIDLTNLATSNSLPALCASLSSICVLFAMVIVGKNVSSSRKYDTISQRIAETMVVISKTKTGISAALDLFREFSTFIHNAIFDMLGLESDNKLLALVTSCKEPDTKDFKKQLIFEYSKFLTNPHNFLSIQSNMFYRDQLRFTVKVFAELSNLLVRTEHRLGHGALQYAMSMHQSLLTVDKAISRTSDGKSIKFNPFAIMLAGDSQTGKSTFASMLGPLIIKTLKGLESHLNINFEIPHDSNWFYSKNFSDPYVTNYTGQYAFFLDDFAQDSPGSMETNSILQFINFCSPTPYATNQAAIDNKGIPFNSKIIILTSNDLSLRNRKEITHPDALYNRLEVAYEIKHNKTAPITPEFAKPVDIYRYSYVDCKRISSQPITVKELVQECIHKYIEWFKKEKNLEIKVQNIQEYANEMVNEYLQTNAALTTPKTLLSTSDDTVESGLLQETSSWRCYFGINPKMRISRIATPNNEYDCMDFDCDCEYHSNWNMAYARYVEYCVEEDIESTTIYEFIKRCENLQSTNEEYSVSYRSSYQQIMDKVKSCLTHPLFKILTAAVAACVVSLGVYALSHKDEETLEDSAKYVIQPKHKNQVKARLGRGPIQLSPTCLFGDKDVEFSGSKPCPSSMRLLEDVLIGRSTVCVLSTVVGNKMLFNTASRIHGKYILTNHHFITRLEEGQVFSITYYNKTQTKCETKQKYSVKFMERIPDTDLAIYLCDAGMSDAKSILKHFPKDEMKLATTNNCMVVTAEPYPVIYANVLAKPNIHRLAYVVGDESYDILDSYESNLPVHRGMSGSLLISMDSTAQHKILGIQTCRNLQNGSVGYFKPVSQKQLLESMNKLQSVNISNNEDQVIEDTCCVLDELCPPNLQKNSLEYFGTLPVKKTIAAQTKSKIKPSLLQNVDRITQEPSILSNFDDRMEEELIGKSVIYRSMQGFDDIIGPVDRNILERAAHQLFQEYDVILNDATIPRRVLNDNEMVNGIPELMLRLNMKTSPGYPFVLERKDTSSSGKKEWFNDITPLGSNQRLVYEMKPKLKSLVEQTEQQLKRNENSSFIAYCCLKDETRPLAKISSGSTRAFMNMPLHYNLLIRKYFGAFVSSLKNHKIEVSSCVGVDPAKDWLKIYDKLMAKNALWEDFDYANWDQHLHPALVMKVADIINQWYNDGKECANVRRILIHNLIYTFVIVKNKLFRKRQGQCSGCAITAELNCVVHDLLMVYCWLKMHQDQGLSSSLSSMRQNVALCVYGDDIIMAVDPNCDIKFNGTTIAPHMSELGMYITPGDKKSTTFILKPPEEIFFLKRNFIKDGSRVYAPLRKDIVENIIQWVHMSSDDVKASITNCETALHESFMHGRQFFTELSNDINDRIKHLRENKPGIDFPPVILDFDALEDEYAGLKYTCAGLVGLDL